MSDCDAIRQLVQPYLDDALGPDERARLEAHAAACARCRELVATYRQLFAALDAPPLPEPSAAFTAAVMRRVGSSRTAAPRWRSWVGAAAIVAICVGAALFVWGELPAAEWLGLGELSLAESGQALAALAGLAAEVVGELPVDLLPLAPHAPLLAIAAAVALAANAALAYRWRALAQTDGGHTTRVSR